MNQVIVSKIGRIKHTSFRPLCCYPNGKKAIEEFGLPAFIDSSCRREPDFESEFPSITSLCRNGMMVKGMCRGDVFVYQTVKGPFGRRLTAILQAIEVFGDKELFNHQAAADWYLQKELALPSNCMIAENLPIEMVKTSGNAQPLEEWDCDYKKRAVACSTFVITKPIFLNFIDPPCLNDDALTSVFGKVPLFINIKCISKGQLFELAKIAGVEIKEA